MNMHKLFRNNLNHRLLRTQKKKKLLFSYSIILNWKRTSKVLHQQLALISHAVYKGKKEKEMRKYRFEFDYENYVACKLQIQQNK